MLTVFRYGVYPIYFQPNTKLWKYFIFNNDIFGCEYRLVGENIYEQIIVRRGKEPGLQGIFYTFPDLEKYYTKDLYQPHPTLAHHWIHRGRADDVIVFSNGEKLNPVTIESTVGSHPDVKRAIVVGQGKFQAGLILEPVQFSADDTMAQNLIRNIWPTIESVNRETVAHGRIAKHMVRISDRAKPIPYSSKGSLQRGQFLKLYEREIEALYDADNHRETVHLNFQSKDSLSKSLEDIVRSLWAVSDLGPDTDFFNAGLDSLQAINFARLLGYGIRQAGFPAERCQITPRLIYANPTLRQLTEYLFLQSSHEASEPSHTWEGVEEAKALLDKYSFGSKDMTVQTKILPAEQEQIILLTGSTGSLGSYLLGLLEGCTSVSKVICLNRAPDGGLSKQIQSSRERGLRTKFVKTEFIQADLSQPHLGINEVTYARLLASVDRIIHNAWPVNFNMFVGTFEPSIKGVRHLADLSFRASKRVPIIFISSTATVGHWTHQEPVPESLLTDMSLASPGYGQSKLIGDLVLSQGAERLGLPVSVLRVGQIAGSRSEQGIWNAHEWLPTIIASSLGMGKLPSDLGTLDMVDWVCIEDVAATVLEIAGITCRQPLSKISGHFNVVNPTRLQWRELALSVQEYYEQQGRKLELVSLASWVETIEESLKHGTETPAVKLLDTFRSMLVKTPEECTTFSTAEIVSLSPTLNKTGPINPQMMKLWCRQWGF
jgi:thioester reductase-like protein